VNAKETSPAAALLPVQGPRPDPEHEEHGAVAEHRQGLAGEEQADVPVPEELAHSLTRGAA